MGNLLSLFSIALSGTLLMAIASSMKQAIAQAQPPCQPPSAGEYLLMVVHQSPDTQETLQDTLPRNATTTVCDYLGSTVTRVGGFADLAVANSWAEYLSSLGGLQAFVTRPASDAPPAAVLPSVPPAPSPSATPTAPTVATVPDPAADPGAAAVDLVEPFPTPTQVAPSSPSSLAVSPVVTPTPSPSASTGTSSSPNPVAIANPTYNPQPLGAGYAVLVDYGYRPGVATEVRQVVAGQVGVVAYEQRPYLLASYTSDLATAAAVLQQLSDRNFSVILVDGRRTILLAPTVANN